METYVITVVYSDGTEHVSQTKASWEAVCDELEELDYTPGVRCAFATLQE